MQEELVTQSIRYVRWLFRRFRTHVFVPDDLAEDILAEGYLGLVAAARRYDPARGSFFTFAKKFVWGHMLDGLCRFNDIPAEVLRRHLRIRTQREKLQAALGREPTVRELAEAVGCRESTLRRTLFWVEARTFVSADEPVRNDADDSVTLGELLPDTSDPEGTLDRSQALQLVLGACDPVQRFVLVKHYLEDRELARLTGPTGQTVTELQRLLETTLSGLRRRFGTPAPTRKSDRLPGSFPRERFWRNVRKTDGCWIWTGTVTRQGYGQFSEKRGGRWVHHLAHRASWLLKHNGIGPGRAVVQTCGNRLCVRPEHLIMTKGRQKPKQKQVA